MRNNKDNPDTSKLKKKHFPPLYGGENAERFSKKGETELLTKPVYDKHIEHLYHQTILVCSRIIQLFLVFLCVITCIYFIAYTMMLFFHDFGVLDSLTANVKFEDIGKSMMKGIAVGIGINFVSSKLYDSTKRQKEQ